MTRPGGDRRVQRVLSSENNDQIAERYDIWAEEYNTDLQSYGYRSPAIVAGIVGRHLPTDTTPILDAGADTGIMGEVLHTLAYRGIIAFDLSKGMLQVAVRKGVYAEVCQMALGGA